MVTIERLVEPMREVIKVDGVCKIYDSEPDFAHRPDLEWTWTAVPQYYADGKLPGGDDYLHATRGEVEPFVTDEQARGLRVAWVMDVAHYDHVFGSSARKTVHAVSADGLPVCGAALPAIIEKPERFDPWPHDAPS